MASTRQCLLNQFADLSVCANQNNFHKNSILVSDLRIYLFTFNLGGQPASSGEHLPRNPASVGRGEERDYIGDIRRLSEPPQRRARNRSLHRLLAHPGRWLPLASHRAGGHRVYRNAPGTEFRGPNASQRIVIACHKVPIQSLSLFASITTTSRSLVPSATAAMP